MRRNKDKKRNMTPVYVGAGLVILLTATAIFLFKPKKTQTYRETGTTNMATYSYSVASEYEDPIEEEEEEVLPDTAYMTVTIPGYSDDDVKKTEEEEADLESVGELPEDSERVPDPSGDPQIVKHYYEDAEGNQTSRPSSGSNTVYVIEYDKNKTKTLTESDVQNIIVGYLNSNETYVKRISNNQKEAEAKKTTTTQKVDLDLSEDNKTSSSKNKEKNSDGVVVETSKTEEQTTATSPGTDPSVLDVETGITIADEDRIDIIQSAPVNVESNTDSENELYSGGVGVQLTWNLHQINDGKVQLFPIVLSRDYITKLEWNVEVIAGEGYLVDTNDDFVKNVHVEDGSAIRVQVNATYTDGITRGSNVITVAHQDYSPN